MRGAALIILCLANAIAGAPRAVAQTGGREPPCLECHKPTDTTIDPAQFAKSVHGTLDCTTCHTAGFDKFPHTGSSAQMPDCIGCHSGAVSPAIDFDKIAQEVKASIHVKLLDPAFRCTNCHSPHYFIPASQMTNQAEALVASNKSCLGCHAAGDTPSGKQLAFKNLAEKHRVFPNWELHIQHNACVACHTPAGQETEHLILPKSEALKNCSECHTRNSLLVTRLYIHLALKERAENGWVNAILFNNAYVTGATRNRWLDWITFLLTALVLLAVAAHGAGRWIMAILRRKS